MGKRKNHRFPVHELQAAKRVRRETGDQLQADLQAALVGSQRRHAAFCLGSRRRVGYLIN